MVFFVVFNDILGSCVEGINQSLIRALRECYEVVEGNISVEALVLDGLHIDVLIRDDQIIFPIHGQRNHFPFGNIIFYTTIGREDNINMSAQQCRQTRSGSTGIHHFQFKALFDQLRSDDVGSCTRLYSDFQFIRMLFRIGFQFSQGIDPQFLVDYDNVPGVQPDDRSEGKIIKAEIGSSAGFIDHKASMVEQDDAPVLFPIFDFPGPGGTTIAFYVGYDNVCPQFLAQFLAQQPCVKVRIPAGPIRNDHFHVLRPFGFPIGSSVFALGTAATGNRNHQHGGQSCTYHFLEHNFPSLKY